MNGLIASLAAAAAVVAANMALCRVACTTDRVGVPFTVGFTAVLLAVSVAAYAALGHWSDYNVRGIDSDVGYLRTAKVTEALRMAKAVPDSVAAQMELAEASMESGRYRDAVKAYDECLRLGAPRMDVLGKKAYALYYRDGRRMGDEARAVVEEALRANPLEVQVRMLLGQDAFLNGRYSEAIGHWKMLLDAGVAPQHTRALETAIGKAERRAREKE